MSDKFFTQNNCGRCGNTLTSRIMSWFTEDTICMDCMRKEREIRDSLPNGGKDYEGCGYLPKSGS